MDGSDPSGDDRLLRSVFSGDGAAKLRERVKEKLKELLENYTDDTLVEYVLVLLKNGRCKDEARKELDVFLGDDCAPFVSWLWDHLSLNLHLYVEPKVSFPVSTTRPLVKEISQTLPRCLNGCVQSSSVDNKVGPANTCRNRHNREWRGLVKEEDTFFVQSTMTEKFTLQDKTQRRTNVRTKYYHLEGQTCHRTKTATGNFCLEEKAYQRTNLTSGNVFLKGRSYHPSSLDKWSHYPIFLNPKKRSRQDERRQTKIHATSRPSPPCRIFQFALQDVVRSVQQTSSTKEPALTRLRSVISTSTSDPTSENQHQMTRPISNAEEALTNVRRSRNLFRIPSHDMGMPEDIHQLSNSGQLLLEGDLTEFDQIPVSSYSSSLDYFDSCGYDAELTRDTTMLEGGTGSSSESDNEEYGEDVDGDIIPARLMDLDSPVTDVATNIMNISVNVNTRKPPYHGNPRDSAKVGNLLFGEKGDMSAAKPYFLLNSAAASEKAYTREKGDLSAAKPYFLLNSAAASEKDVVHDEVQEEPQEPVASLLDSHCTSHSGDDIDSRILFVSNVHFAATKDALSSHFNKFGEVLKVIIMTDPATRKPKGTAFVEFLQKESAEQALSLNGISFMSRVLKVARSSVARHDAASLVMQPQDVIASASVPISGKYAYPRSGLPSVFSARLPVNPGARSLQWKRGASTAESTEGINNFQKASLPGRSFTYIRSAPKAEV